MRIGIIGAGNVGRALGLGWLRAGHEVAYGVRHPEATSYRNLDEAGARVASIPVAVEDAEVVVLAIPWNATETVIKSAGGLGDKIVIDCTNPLPPDLFGLTHAHDDSGGEQVARWAPNARVVKAFNSVGANIMQDPELEDRAAVMFICGDETGKQAVQPLSEVLGFETIDLGPLDSARLLEPLALLWISAAFRHGLGRDFAFSIVRRKPEATG